MAPPNKAAWLGLGLMLASLARAELPAVDALREADALCRGDNGALWGVSLCGPVLLVDPATRSVFASQADREQLLKREGEIFVGKLPGQVNIANTAVDWAGTRWTMIMLPMPEDRHRRASLLAHEMWHRVQEQLGLPQSGAANEHLATRDGRYWLQLEWRALAAALQTTGPARKEASEDGALFRAYRRQLFPQAAKSETEMELNEGLAEYTGAKLSGAQDVARFVVEHELKEATEKKTFVRSFAYATGPAYGILLDETGADWRQTIRASRRDLAEFLCERVGITLPEKIGGRAIERASKYRGADLAAEEDRREQSRREVDKDYRARLIDGPVLAIPLFKMNMQFDPGNLVPLDSAGTVYPNIRIADDWGILTVTKGGALLSADFSRVTVPAPKSRDANPMQGDGWKLDLKPGWLILPGDRPGDFKVRPVR